MDNTVDITTGTIKLKGTFPNADHKLWPGQFVRVTLRLTTQQNAVVVPNQAIQTGQTGAFVYVVKQDKTVESRPVVTGCAGGPGHGGQRGPRRRRNRRHRRAVAARARQQSGRRGTAEGAQAGAADGGARGGSA